MDRIEAERGYQRGQQMTHDLSTLVQADLQTILDVLRERFYSQQIYTNIGDILLSCNPCQYLPIYGHQIGRSYTRVQTAVSLSPHVFTTACRAHRYLSLHPRDQGILLLGESGSGKTECLKMLVSQLGRLSSPQTEAKQGRNVASLLSEALHILDEFGNADTGVNKNASRFAKFLETIWEGETLVGAEIKCQGLEKGRVMYAGEGQKNFHVFYRMLAGFEPDLLRRHQHNQSYRILEPAEGGSIFRDRAEGEMSRDSFHYLRECLNSLGLDQEMHQSGGVTAFAATLEALSAILHLGNIHFAPDPESDSAFVANPPEVEAAARLLGIHVDDLLSLTLRGVTESRDERVEYKRDVGGASRTRNLLVGYIYEQLFHWLVEAINNRIKPDETASTSSGSRKAVGILDAPGYENLQCNGLEQLHLNMADERLRQYIIDHVIRQESDDLDREGVKGQKFEINTEVIEVFFNRDSGLLRLIDDHSCPSTTESDLLKAIRKSYKKRAVVQTANTGDAFMVAHYRGQVSYDMRMLLTKNTPTRTHPFRQVLEYSRNTVLQDIARRAGHQSQDHGDVTTTRKYNSSLSSILARLEEREIQYVWCFRPNMTSNPHQFDDACVAKQLAAMNVSETMELRARGYPIRLTLKDFIDSYKFIAFPLSARLDPLGGACHRIIRMAGLPDGGWLIKSKKVFLTLWHQDYLDAALERALSSVVFVQSHLRGFVARRRFHRMRNKLQKGEDVLLQFSDHVTDLALSTFYACQCQNDHNIRERERRHTGRDGGRRRPPRRHSATRRQDDYYNSNNYYNDERYRGGGGEVYSAYIEEESDEMAEFTKTVVHEVLSKQRHDPDSWAKVLCMEYDEPVGKFFIDHRDITIDGSYNVYDDNRIGLGIFRNPNRDRETENIRGYLGKGLTISRDADGNIWMKRLTQNDVIIAGYTDPANHSLSADVITAQGKLPYQTSIKVFDMNELRSRVGIEMKSSTFNRQRLLQQTVTCVSLLTSGSTPLDSPCWLCVVNLVAINMLHSPEVISDVERMVAQISVRSEEDREKTEKATEASRRHERTSWSRVNQRESITHKESARKARIKLREEGQPISDHMSYSWENATSGHPSKKQLDSIQGQMRGEGHSREQGQGSVRQWAKAKVVAKESRLKEEEY